MYRATTHPAFIHLAVALALPATHPPGQKVQFFLGSGGAYASVRRVRRPRATLDARSYARGTNATTGD
eukprot:5684-Pelagococcus_subviridis.AAC.3